MKAQSAGDAVGDQVVNVFRLQETEESSRADAESSGELIPGQVVCPLLVPQGPLQGTRRETARKIIHEEVLLVMWVGNQKAAGAPKRPFDRMVSRYD